MHASGLGSFSILSHIIRNGDIISHLEGFNETNGSGVGNLALHMTRLSGMGKIRSYLKVGGGRGRMFPRITASLGQDLSNAISRQCFSVCQHLTFHRTLTGEIPLHCAINEREGLKSNTTCDGCMLDLGQVLHDDVEGTRYGDGERLCHMLDLSAAYGGSIMSPSLISRAQCSSQSHGSFLIFKFF
jgi:hypothetical protein